MNRKTLAIARGVGAIGAVVALVVGVTFAAENSNSVTLSDNTVGVGSASLQIAGTDQNFTTNIQGFQANTLIPGGSPSSPFFFYLRNNGDADLGLGVASNLNGQTPGILDTAIHGKLYSSADGFANPLEQFTLADIDARQTYAPPSPVTIAHGQTIEYKVVWQADANAATGSGGVATPPFTLTISGTSIGTP